MKNNLIDQKDYYQHQEPYGFLPDLILNERKKIYKLFLDNVKPNASMRILDVGVSSIDRSDINFFEKLYPFPEQIVATGLGNPPILAKEYGFKFVQVNGKTLPFKSKSFDVAVSFAVLEHVGGYAQQREFVSELCRVAKTCFIVTPNKWFPLEFHTLLPFVHWLPKRIFRKILRMSSMSFYSKEENLNLLTMSELKRLFPVNFQLKEFSHKLFFLPSNIGVYAKPCK